MASFKKFLSVLSSFSGLFLAFAGLSNFVLAYRACSVSRSVVVTNFVASVVVPSNSVDVAVSLSSTNSISVPIPSSLPASTPFPPSPSERVPSKVADYPYEYFVVGRRIGARMFGRYYYDGSPCSYGRIFQIFPDRILLEGGDWISNTTPFGSADLASVSRLKGSTHE